MKNISSALLFTTSFILAAYAQAQDVKTGADAFGTWKDDKPGIVRHIRAKDLPPPDQSNETANFAQPIKMPDGAKPILPKGFSAELIATGLKSPRIARISPNGDIFVADSKAGEIHVYRLQSDSSKIETDGVFAKGLHQPYGIAFYPPGANPKWVYVANSYSVVRYPYKEGDLAATGTPEVIVDHIPAYHHWTRDIAFSADGSKLYVAVGSGSNIALDMAPAPYTEGGLDAWKKEQPLGATWDTEEKRGQVLSYDPDGKNEKIVATGLRNCSGLAIEPNTKALWCAVNERDGLGDNTPFDYATHVEAGAFYGWPWYYIGNHQDPRKQGQRPDLAEKVTTPDVMFQGHSAPLGIAFYDGKSFPDEFQGDAFVALHGSWNRTGRTGYKVVALDFKDGKATGKYSDFMTGFVISDKEVWGRPVGLVVAKDGSLIVTEDGNGSIWRVSYKKDISDAQ
jgi:glucose/arabinose dehydrogenase